MVSAFLVLVPMAPFALMRACEAAERSPLAPVEAELPVLPICCSPLGALADPDGGGPLPPLPGPTLQRAARRWAWRPLEVPSWKILTSDHFMVRGDVPLEDLRRVAACLEAFLEAMRETLGGDPPVMRHPVRIFAAARDFRLYASLAGAPNAESFYDPRTAEMVLCLDPPRGPEWLHRTLAHELTHLYMDRVWGRTEPLWFAEGLAEYFASFQVRDGRVLPGAVDPEALRRLREREPLPLGRFLRIGREELYGDSFPYHYAQAWSFVHYLFSRKDGLIDLLLRGGSLEDPEAMEEGWRGHVKKLLEVSNQPSVVSGQ